MPLLVNCTACCCRLEAASDAVGKQFSCPYCGADVRIERPTEPVETDLPEQDVKVVPPPTEVETDPARVFISHSSRDREFVEEEIVEYLKENGVDTWYSNDDIQYAELWQTKIIQGLQSCNWFMIVMSENSQQSENVKDELHWAIAQRDGRIIPVIIADCDPLGFHIRMNRIHHVDFRGNLTDARARLIGRLRGEP